LNEILNENAVNKSLIVVQLEMELEITSSMHVVGLCYTTWLVFV